MNKPLTRQYEIHFTTPQGGTGIVIEVPEDFVVGPENGNSVTMSRIGSSEFFTLDGPGKVLRINPRNIAKEDKPRFGKGPYTPAQMSRVVRDYSEIAQEAVKVQLINGFLYVFASELACLRIHRKLPGRVEYSMNLKTWFFERDLNPNG